MKTIITAITVVLLLLTSPMTMAQDDIFGAIMEAAAAQENANIQAQSEAEGAAQSEAAAAWQEEWGEIMEENAEILEAFDTKYLKCTAMMILYVYEYLTLVEATKAEGDCKMKYDLYGMQLLYMASSTTIMYCPEEIASLSSGEQDKIYDEFINILIDHFGIEDMYDEDATEKELEEIIDMAASSGGPYGSLLGKLASIAKIVRAAQRSISTYDRGQGDGTVTVLRSLTTFFNPSYIIPRTLEIGKIMSAMGCGG